MLKSFVLYVEARRRVVEVAQVDRLVSGSDAFFEHAFDASGMLWVAASVEKS
jgi:hypothetical protein